MAADTGMLEAGLAEALESLIAQGATPSDAYAAIAPHVGQEALRAAAQVEPDKFAADLIRPSSQSSRLRDPDALPWLSELQAIVRRLAAGPQAVPGEPDEPEAAAAS